MIISKGREMGCWERRCLTVRTSGTVGLEREEEDGVDGGRVGEDEASASLSIVSVFMSVGCSCSCIPLTERSYEVFVAVFE